MPFTYHPPTRTRCEVCEEIVTKYQKPLITTAEGRASNADNFPFHNWYNFVLGYSPKFPDYILERERAGKQTIIADPFAGSGTTNICAKQRGIQSVGLDANDFFVFTAQTKLDWQVDTEKARKIAQEILVQLQRRYSEYEWPEPEKNQLPLLQKGTKSYLLYVRKHRTSALPERYISDAPLAKLLLLKELLSAYNYPDEKFQKLFALAFAAVAQPSSNVYYGPGFGVRKPKLDADVYSLFQRKIHRMIDDLEQATAVQRDTVADVSLGDAREMSRYFGQGKIDLMITSPPYPGDHEYTKHSKLELIFMDFATTLEEFRVIKKRMLRGSTTNIYKDDADGELVKDMASLQAITQEIDKRLKADGATSGFEKLYVKLVWEYFGGMYRVFQEANKCLKPGGKFALLVSDSHAFKMVHIKTAELLAETAVKAGMVNPHIELWQHKLSTSHKYNLFEEVLTVERAT